MNRWYWVQQVGHENGPCPDESCLHGNCRSARAVASAPCSECAGPIGFGRFLVLELDGDRLRARHRECWERAIGYSP